MFENEEKLEFKCIYYFLSITIINEAQESIKTDILPRNVPNAEETIGKAQND